MDYSFFLRGALDLGTRAVGAYERHVTVAEGRLAWDRDRPVFDEGLLLPGEHGPHDGPPPPPEAADGFSFHMPAAEPEPADDDAFRVDYAAEGRAKAEAFGPRVSVLPDPEVTDLARAQAEVLIERAKVEALKRQVAELQAAVERPSIDLLKLARDRLDAARLERETALLRRRMALGVEVHLVGRRDGTPEEIERSTEVIRPRPGEIVKLYTEDWATKHTEAEADKVLARVVQDSGVEEHSSERPMWIIDTEKSAHHAPFFPGDFVVSTSVDRGIHEVVDIEAKHPQRGWIWLIVKPVSPVVDKDAF